MKKNKRKRNGLKGIVLFIFWMGFSIIFTSVLLAQDPYLADVVVTPENPTMQVGQSLEFTASGKDQNGDPFPISDPQWEGSSHGTLSVNPTDPAKCTFTTTKTGAGYIICWEGPPRRGPHGSTDITITQGSGQVLGSIVVSPTNVNLEFGEQQQFTALGYDQNDEPMDPPITPIWSTDGGTVTQSGQYTAPSSAGDYTVTAGTSGSSITGTANVHVTAPSQVLGSVVVSPASVDLEYGEQQQFSATGYDQNGNPTDPPITPIWSTDGGTVTQSGDYTAPDTTGDYTVTGGVSGSTITGTANVHVTAPSQVLGSVVVSPANVNLEVGGQQQFSATGYDQNGNPTDPPITPMWSTDGGTVTQGGQYTAPDSAGDYTVTAKDPGTQIQGRAQVHIIGVSCPDPAVTITGQGVTNDPAGDPATYDPTNMPKRETWEGAQGFYVKAAGPDGTYEFNITFRSPAEEGFTLYKLPDWTEVPYTIVGPNTIRVELNLVDGVLDPSFVLAGKEALI